MIKPSTEYALVLDGLVVAKGSAASMRKKKAKAAKATPNLNYKIYNSPSTRVGDKIGGSK